MQLRNERSQHVTNWRHLGNLVRENFIIRSHVRKTPSKIKNRWLRNGTDDGDGGGDDDDDYDDNDEDGGADDDDYDDDYDDNDDDDDDDDDQATRNKLFYHLKVNRIDDCSMSM